MIKILVEEHPDTSQWWWHIKLANGTKMATSTRAYGSQSLACKSAGRMAELMFPRPQIEVKPLTKAQRDRVLSSRAVACMY